MSNPLIVFALEQESTDLFQDHNVLFTGVGKVQACVSLIQHLQNNKPSLVVNLGTAGGKNFKTGTVVNPTSFVQRDMDATPLGFEAFATPYAAHPVKLEYGIRIESLENATCGTGDNFSVAENFGNGLYNVVDMEAYALAYICQRYEIPFLCLKYISDNANEAADTDWHASLRETSRALKSELENYLYRKAA